MLNDGKKYLMNLELYEIEKEERSERKKEKRENIYLYIIGERQI